MTTPYFYPVGTSGQAWGDTERALWRARQVRQRSYADDVLNAIEGLLARFDVETYGEVVYGEERFSLMAIRSRNWQSGLPSVLVTGGVHGYETSGVHGALRFAQAHSAEYAGRIDLHETTDTDESEFGPAKAARDGKPFEAHGIPDARYTSTTEVYPDSPRATPEECIAAQVAAVCAAVEFVCRIGR